MSQEKVTVIAYIEVKPGTEEEFMKHAATVTAATRAEAACINYDLHQAPGATHKFVFYENWTSMDGLSQHAASAHIQRFRNDIADLITKPTEVTIWKMVSEPAG